MPDIDFGRISESLNEKSDRDLRNVDTTAKADAVIDYQEPTSANNYTWYRKYASGWVEQGGNGSTMNMTINFPVEMANTYYYASMGFVIAGIGAQNVTKYTNRLVTTSDARDSCTYGGWYVCGMAA